MDIEQMNSLSPFVREVKIAKSNSLSGEWLDYDHVFTYIEQGEAVFVLGGISYEVSEGDIVFITPFIPHIIRSISDTPLVQYICHLDCQYDVKRSMRRKIGSAYGESRNVPLAERMFSGHPPVARIRQSDRGELKRNFLMMLKEFKDESSEQMLMLKAGALVLLSLFLRNQSDFPAREARTSSSWPIIEKCITIIQVQFANPQLSNELISNLAGISVSHMTYLFREELGVSVHKYLTYVRIQRAKRMLENGADSLTRVAELTGFSGIHQFSRTFKAITGMTASQYMVTSNIQGGVQYYEQ